MRNDPRRAGGRVPVNKIIPFSSVDGPGNRTAVFVQGCNFNCHYCHNPETWKTNGGREADTDEVARMIDRNPLLDGLTLSGGEPFMQPEAAAEMAAYAKGKGLNVWAYTGYTWEQLMANQNEAVQRLLGLVDVLVDGPFVLKLRSLSLRFCGSSNQRLIDMAATRAAGQAVLWQPPAW